MPRSAGCTNDNRRQATTPHRALSNRTSFVSCERTWWAAAVAHPSNEATEQATSYYLDCFISSLSVKASAKTGMAKALLTRSLLSCDPRIATQHNSSDLLTCGDLIVLLPGAQQHRAQVHAKQSGPLRVSFSRSPKQEPPSGVVRCAD